MSTLKAEYLKRAIDTGNKNAVNLVREFFDGGVADNLTATYRGCWGFSIGSFEWSLSDLDRALNVMEQSK